MKFAKTLPNASAEELAAAWEEVQRIVALAIQRTIQDLTNPVRFPNNACEKH